MDIIFKNKKFETLCNSQKAMQCGLGARQAKVLRRRLDDLRAASNLEAMKYLPGRCHSLHGDRDDQLSVDLEHPKRLVFEPSHEIKPVKTDGGLDWAGVTAIRILEIVDYH